MTKKVIGIMKISVIGTVTSIAGYAIGWIIGGVVGDIINKEILD